MIRRTRWARPTPRVEPLEPRALMTGYPDGMWPLANPGPSTSLLVRFSASIAPGVEAADLASIQGRVVRSEPDGSQLIMLGEGIDPASEAKALGAEPLVVFAQADATIQAESLPIDPDDPAFSQDWGLNNANNVDIDAPEAWGITTGNPTTIVAVVDSGIDLSNADFFGKVWTNPVNDAAFGYPDDVHGWNFVSNNNNVQDDNGHGTHVSGIIAAAGSNGVGSVGVDWNAQIMPLKFLDQDGNGSTDEAVAAIDYAVDHGARVINASWGGVANSPALYNAIAYASAHNVVFVTAAGNEGAGNKGADNDVTPSYPASYRLPNTLSVAAVDRNGNLPSFSNYGAQTVDLAAPGVDIVSDAPSFVSSTGLQSLTGTSMSTAYVSGVVALVAGVHPEFTAAQLVQRIDATVKPLPSLIGKTITGGMVDAAAALAPDAGLVAGYVATAGGTVLTPAGSTDSAVRATILASDEFLAAHGGTAEGFITGLYEDLLDREPDQGGLSGWAGLYRSGTVTRFQLVVDFLDTPEGRLTEVAHWFQQDLGRTASIATLKADPGLLYWTDLLLDGFGDATVEALLMSVPEYLFGHGGAPAPVVDGYYQDIDGRSDTDFERTNWAGLFDEGNVPFVVARLFQSTPEALATKVARWYIQDLRRPETISELKADPGVRGWAGLLGNF